MQTSKQRLAALALGISDGLQKVADKERNKYVLAGAAGGAGLGFAKARMINKIRSQDPKFTTVIKDLFKGTSSYAPVSKKQFAVIGALGGALAGYGALKAKRFLVGPAAEEYPQAQQ